MTEPVDLKTFNYPGEIYLKADPQTSFQFYYAQTFFTALPSASLFFQEKTREIYLNGEFFWQKEKDDPKVEVYLTHESQIGDLSRPQRIDSAEENNQSPRTVVKLGRSGRIKVGAEQIQIWNYSGNSEIIHDGALHRLNQNQMFKFIDGKATIHDLLPAPEYISPEKKTVHLSTKGDSIVKFSWKNVPGASQYLLRLYSSNLKENILWEKSMLTNRKSIDLLRFVDAGEIYWEVYPYDTSKELEGIPSKAGEIKIVGVLFEEEKTLEPPRLVITSLTVSGNMVLIKGEADVDSQLFIDNETVKIDMDGKFIYTITYKSIGKKTIRFRLISPSEIETALERQVSIFEE